MPLALLSDIEGHVPQNNEDRIFSLLFSEDELTWQTMIYELVKTESMDPWNISVSVIAEKFTTMLRKMTDMDFRISGKMVLAAALLLKIKSERLMKEDIVALDNLINSSDEDPEFLDELADFAGLFGTKRSAQPLLIPRTPQPRQRKVSVYDLVEALEKALNTETRKQWRTVDTTPRVEAPKKGTDMSVMINDVFEKVKKGLSASTSISFDRLIPSTSKEDKVYTFIPLLHLDTQRKIDLLQKTHLGEIMVKLNKYALSQD